MHWERLVAYETTYLFFNLLLIGLVSSEIYYRSNRSQRTGLALGLTVVGLLLSELFKPSLALRRGDWFRVGLVIFLTLILFCSGELIWGEAQFKVIAVSLLILVGVLSVWSQGSFLHLPPVFWLFVSTGAAAATFGLGPATIDMGAYVAAWVWVILAHYFTSEFIAPE